MGHAVKRVYTPHMFYTMQPGRRIKPAVALFEAGLSRLCHGVVAVSQEEYSHALDLGIARSKIYLIPNGISLEQPQLSFADRHRISPEVGTR